MVAWMLDRILVVLQDRVVGISTVLVFMMVFMMVYMGTQKPAGIPPGPPIYIPFLGHIPSLVRHDLYQYLRHAREQYGDIFSLYMGSNLLVIFNGYPVMREALVGKAGVFSNRPVDDFIAHTKNGLGLIFTSGEQWRKERTFASKALKKLGFGRESFEDKVRIELQSLLTLIESHGEEPFDMKDYLFFSAANILCMLIASKRYDYSDPKLHRYIKNQQEAVEVLGLASVAYKSFPFLKYFPGDMFGLHALNKEKAFFTDFFDTLYKGNTDTYTLGNVRNLSDCYFERDGMKSISANTLELFGDYFGAGTETTSTTLLWLLLYLAVHKECQERCRREIHTLLGIDTLPSRRDRNTLPYVVACICEAMRIAYVVTLGLPHAVSRDIDFHGYRIPKEATVILNVNSIFMDSTLFKEPEKFIPERFLDENEELKIPEEFIPFGLGKRACLGETSAKIELFLFTVGILQRYRLETEPGVVPDFKGTVGFGNAPKPFKLRAVRCR